jgi:alanyl-tRNA synthetase
VTDKLPENIIARFSAKIDRTRRWLTANNHSATHLLHAALRKVLGTHVEQKGSLVNEEHLRFDFSHFSKMTDEEISEVERIVNEKIRENIFSEIKLMTIEDAKKTGAMALFGEKYGDIVRVVTFDKEFSVELCGGTHVKATGQIGIFKIASEGAVAAGVRRIEAITSLKAEEFYKEQTKVLHEIKTILKNPKDVVRSIQSLADENAELQRQLQGFLKEKASALKNDLISKKKSVNGINLIADVIDLDSAEEIKNMLFEMRGQVDNLVCVVGATINGKASLSVILSDNLVKEKNMNASTMVRELSKDINGGGGGQPFYATAGGTNPAGLEAAVKKAAAFVN